MTVRSILDTKGHQILNVEPDAKLDEYREVRASLGRTMNELMAEADEPAVVADAVLKAATGKHEPGTVEVKLEDQGTARVLVYSTPDRTGTIKLFLALPGMKASELDPVLTQGDRNFEMIRNVLGDKPMLIILQTESAR